MQPVEEATKCQDDAMTGGEIKKTLESSFHLQLPPLVKKCVCEGGGGGEEGYTLLLYMVHCCTHSVSLRVECPEISHSPQSQVSSLPPLSFGDSATYFVLYFPTTRSPGVHPKPSQKS